jgi:hypothetical protein
MCASEEKGRANRRRTLPRVFARARQRNRKQTGEGNRLALPE